MKQLKKLGYISIGAILAVGIMLLTVPGLAAGTFSFGTETLKINGKTTSLPVINYEGYNYIRLRDIAPEINYVAWWSAEAGVNFDTQAYKNMSESTNYSRANPAPIGVSQTLTVDAYQRKYSATLTVKEAIRGEAAWTKIKNELFDIAPPAGKEYILAKVSITIWDCENDTAVSCAPYDFSVFSNRNVEIVNSYMIGEKIFVGDVYAGGTLEGYIVFTIDSNDTGLKIAYGRSYDGTGGVWFKLTE
ncbi:MAG: hypothetical protein LBN97_02545 [Oscillospiraceae bacterium]|jgi:hypothetical protein|nr:hypothetical protein [Oscillospiraceae bacterium]